MDVDNRIRFFCERRIYADDFAIHMAMGQPVHSVALPVVFEKRKMTGDYAEPAMTLEGSAAQELMDELWRAGLRPTQGKQSEGVTAAQARHLEDMRALAFAKLNVTRPGGD